MKFLTILYAMFCFAVIALFTFAATRSYSPFADGGARMFTSAYRGPTHK